MSNYRFIVINSSVTVLSDSDRKMIVSVSVFPLHS